MVRLENVRKVFYQWKWGRKIGANLVLDNLSYHIKEGEIHGLAGKSGAGKSTLARIILRLIRYDSGRILFRGSPLEYLPEREFRHDVQMIFQDPYAELNRFMTIDKIIYEVLQIHRKDLKTKEERRREIVRIFDRVGLGRYNNHGLYPKPTQISGGERRRVSIARVIAVKSRFIVLDEPFNNLDSSMQAQMVRLIQDIHKEHNLTMLLISHDRDIVEYLCQDRVLCL